MGGALAAIDNGFFQKEIADSAYRYQREIDSGDRVVVGVNAYKLNEPVEIPLLQMDKEGERRHLERLNRVRRERDNALVSRRLEELRKAAEGDGNLMPPILEAVRDYATLGEIMQVLRDVFGEYRERAIL